MGSEIPENARTPKTGAKRAFFAVNDFAFASWANRFQEIALEEGLVPDFYVGANRTLVNPSGFPGTAKEIRDDFYNAKIKVLYLGSPTQEHPADDHWALHELKHVSDATLRVYVAPEYPQQVLRQAGYVGEIVVVSGLDEFSAAVRSQLKSIALSG